ncbi:radical SAM/SPASM domain-containing protein [Pseudovibrio sp. Alg231-02]|uniref:radical SAM/SPASM domain-containing protein n=1 Tax=Pseudovibrio sp. Alg231-02 TaxID=1922223 RepID=UPI0018FFEADD|nr:radical SAM protein [Pseudovibrio sp. Alg231-02]
MKIQRFKDLGYTTIFNPKTGFFARVEDSGQPEPFWAPHGPELMDIAITNWCDKGCAFCYRSSDKSGYHMAVSDYEKLIEQAADMGVYQVALGGGNPNQHPQFIDILRITHEAGIVPNYTTNGRGLTFPILQASSKYCGAVAVSAYKPYDETTHAIESLLKADVKVNVHFVVDAVSVETAIRWLEQPPSFLSGINALVFLNYKPMGRKIFERKLLRNSELQQRFFEVATSSSTPFKIGFDACCVSGLFGRVNVNSSSVDACDAARFSLFVAEDMRVYPCSFQRGLHAGEQITDATSLKDIWLNSDNFDQFRKYFSSDTCGGCLHKANCKNGCPIFEDLVVCGQR